MPEKQSRKGTKLPPGRWFNVSGKLKGGDEDKNATWQSAFVLADDWNGAVMRFADRFPNHTVESVHLKEENEVIL